MAGATFIRQLQILYASVSAPSPISVKPFIFTLSKCTLHVNLTGEGPPVSTTLSPLKCIQLLNENQEYMPLLKYAEANHFKSHS